MKSVKIETFTCSVTGKRQRKLSGEIKTTTPVAKEGKGRENELLGACTKQTKGLLHRP